VPPEQRVRKGRKATPDQPDLREPLEQPARRVHKDQREQRGRLERKGRKAIPGIPDPLAQREQLVPRGQLAPKDRQELQAQLAPRVQRVTLAILGHKALREYRD
jgi:hypothetical protein